MSPCPVLRGRGFRPASGLTARGTGKDNARLRAVACKAGNPLVARLPRGPGGATHGGAAGSMDGLGVPWIRCPQEQESANRTAEGYPSGQRGQTVNLLAHAFGGSNPPPSTSSMMHGFPGGGFEPPNRNAGSTEPRKRIGTRREAARPRRGGGQDARSNPPPSTSSMMHGFPGGGFEPPIGNAGSTEPRKRIGTRREAARPRRGGGQDARSNPPPSTRMPGFGIRDSFLPGSRFRTTAQSGSSSMVEPQPSKLIVRVRFPSPAPSNQAPAAP